MAVAGIGFGLSVIQNVRTTVELIHGRYSEYLKGPTTLQELTNKLDAMISDRATIDGILVERPSIMPDEIFPMFSRRVDTVRECLEQSQALLDELSQYAFPGSNSKRQKISLAKFRRIFRKDKIIESMEVVKSKVKEAARELQGLRSELTTALKVEEINLNSADDHKEPSFVANGNAPMLPSTVTLDYDSKNPEGDYETPEGNLKHCVLISDSSTIVTAAVGVVGMAGVGKTIALQGLAHDENIKARFPHDVYYMSIGQEATLQHVIREIARILFATGATVIADKVENSVTLTEAVDYAVTWFRGLNCLFLVDDLWPVANPSPGTNVKIDYLNGLLQLLRGSPESRMAISTRSVDIASHPGLMKVDFEARNAHTSLRLFMKYATRSTSSEASSEPIHPSVSRILSICGGLPIALSIAGCAVKCLDDIMHDFNVACDTYADDHERTRRLLEDKEGSYGTSLKASIMVSLKYLDDEFLNWKSINAPEIIHTVTDLYIGLCVVQNQAWVPLSVLRRLWSVDEVCALHVMERICKMSLAKGPYRRGSGKAEAGLVLHDLHLDFCRLQAQLAKKQCVWHACMLNGYLKRNADIDATYATSEGSGVEAEELLKFSPREWWCVEEDGYIHMNVTRHLACSNQHMEIGSLLLDARWTYTRIRWGGILALCADFKFVGGCELEKKSFELILKALQLSWSSIAVGQRALQFQLCGRLCGLEEENKIVSTFLRSMEKHTARPYLLPRNQFLGSLHASQLLEISTRVAPCLTVAYSPCGIYIAAGAMHDIVVADAATGDILQRLEGHKSIVTTVTFCGESGTIVSGAWDKTIFVWQWEKSESPVRALKGHSGIVTSIAVSRDGEKIFSGSDDCTMRIWDTRSGTSTGVYVQGSPVHSVSLSADGGKVALGLGNGKVQVVDSSTGRNTSDIRAHREEVFCTLFSPNGAHLATCGDTIWLWNVETLRPIREFVAYGSCFGFSPDGKKIACGSRDGFIRVWNTRTGQCIGKSPKIHDDVRSVVFSSDGGRIACALTLGTVQVWDALFPEAISAEVVGHTDMVYDVDISLDGRRVASASADGTIRLWDSESGVQIGDVLEGHEGSVFSVSFHPDGKQVVSGSTDCTIRVWDTSSGTELYCLEGHTDYVNCVSFSFDGRRIVSGSDDTTVRIWNAESYKAIGDALQGHEDGVVEVSESRDGKHIVSRGVDENIFIWKCSSREIVWKWKKDEIPETIMIRDTDAAIIIRTCAERLSWELLSALSTSNSEIDWGGVPTVYCVGGRILYINEAYEEYVVGIVQGALSWKCDTTTNMFAAGLENGRVMIGKLVREEQ